MIFQTVSKFDRSFTFEQGILEQFDNLSVHFFLIDNVQLFFFIQVQYPNYKTTCKPRQIMAYRNDQRKERTACVKSS